MAKKSDAGIELSIVIPTVNSENHISSTLSQVVRKVEQFRVLGLIKRFEVIPVAQISDDNTFAVLHNWEANNSLVKPCFLKKRGKGLACNFGMHKAQYPWVLFFDDDMDYPINFLLDAAPLTPSYDIIIAFRVGRQYMPLTRRLASFCYRKLAHSLFGLHGIRDIQAGEKLVRKQFFCQKFHEAWDICDGIHLSEHGFVWDTELLFKARRKGLKIAEVPIVYTYHENFLKLSGAWLEMGADLLRLRWKSWEEKL